MAKIHKTLAPAFNQIRELKTEVKDLKKQVNELKEAIKSPQINVDELVKEINEKLQNNQ